MTPRLVVEALGTLIVVTPLDVATAISVPALSDVIVCAAEESELIDVIPPPPPPELPPPMKDALAVVGNPRLKVRIRM